MHIAQSRMSTALYTSYLYNLQIRHPKEDSVVKRISKHQHFVVCVYTMSYQFGWSKINQDLYPVAAYILQTCPQTGSYFHYPLYHHCNGQGYPCIFQGLKILQSTLQSCEWVSVIHEMRFTQGSEHHSEKRGVPCMPLVNMSDIMHSNQLYDYWAILATVVIKPESMPTYNYTCPFWGSTTMLLGIESDPVDISSPW